MQRNYVLLRCRAMEQQQYSSLAIADLADGLHAIATKIELWRLTAKRLREFSKLADANQTVDQTQLQQVEEISGEIYREIAAFDLIVADVGKLSTESAAELGAVGDALRLVLLEITELGTHLYSISSGLAAPAD
ncbi:MAG TPA: hypothetical protein VGO70_05365 [Arsenicitalea sp.]|jgi:hypothetical protein|nr:hypothetical protein [Arsenicitalea sp.]